MPFESDKSSSIIRAERSLCAIGATSLNHLSATTLCGPELRFSSVGEKQSADPFVPTPLLCSDEREKGDGAST
uniref:Uncharacterized protein n=1 Tax=Arundo donax TaxID=35708 RepID=A0A0A9PBC7_ARUDO